MVKSGFAFCVLEVDVSAFARQEFGGFEFSLQPRTEGRFSANHIDSAPATFDKQLHQCAISTTSDSKPHGIDGVATVRCD